LYIIFFSQGLTRSGRIFYTSNHSEAVTAMCSTLNGVEVSHSRLKLFWKVKFSQLLCMIQLGLATLTFHAPSTYSFQPSITVQSPAYTTPRCCFYPSWEDTVQFQVFRTYKRSIQKIWPFTDERCGCRS